MVSKLRKFQEGDQVLIMTGGYRPKWDFKVGTIVSYRNRGGSDSQYLVEVPGMGSAWIEVYYLEKDLSSDESVRKFSNLSTRHFLSRDPELRRLHKEGRFEEVRRREQAVYDVADAEVDSYLESAPDDAERFRRSGGGRGAPYGPYGSTFWGDDHDRRVPKGI